MAKVRPKNDALITPSPRRTRVRKYKLSAAGNVSDAVGVIEAKMRTVADVE